MEAKYNMSGAALSVLKSVLSIIEKSESDLENQLWNHQARDDSFFRSPLEFLDEKRLSDNDFHMNGIDAELDDLDVLLVERRHCKRTFEKTSPTDIELSMLNDQTRAKKKRPNNGVCVFCKNNGELSSLYGGHILKNDQGITVCPVLRRYTCPKCGASGDSAHTIKYCPRTTVYDKLRMARYASK